MRVHIYKQDDGAMSVMVVPRRSAHLPPVLIKGVTRENLKSRVGPVVRAVSGEQPDAP